MAAIASFDVFDTVLMRTIGGPRQVFVSAGRRLLHDGVITVEPEVYAAAREQAGMDLTSDIRHHPPLLRIAEEVAARLGLPTESAPRLEQAEVDVERDGLRAVPGAPARMERSRQETGRGVVFISDTSFPESVLREILMREGLFHTSDRLFTSAGSGASKQDGALFDVVAAELGVSPAEIVHTGDDRWSDLAHGRLHGLTANLDTRAQLTSRERALDRQAVSSGGMGPRFAGAARVARLQAAELGLDAGLAAIAGSVALPLLAGFGLWVLRQAELLNLDRLYFVSRDGEIFRDVTSTIAAQADTPIECRYLYGSRMSWHLAGTGIARYDQKGEMWLPDEATAESLSTRAVLALVDLTPSDAEAITGDASFSAGRAHDILGTEGWNRLRELIAGNALSGEISRRTRARRELLVRYLDQEGVTASGRVGLVDVGWTGRAARSLEDVLTDAGRPLPAAYLFVGLRGSSPELMGADLHSRSRGWLVDEARGRVVRSDTEDPVMLIESFAMGTEGHTTGYEKSDDLIEPVLAAAENPAAQRWDLAGYRRALGLAVDAFLDGPPPDSGIDLRPLVWGQVLSFWRQPSRIEARAWGAQPYGEDFGNAMTHPLATPATARRLLTRLGVGPARWRQPTYWLAGTIVLSPSPWRQLLGAVDSLQRASRRLPRIPARVRGELAIRRR
ncbi:MAG: hypothetical protein JWM76_1464 [Pseudonocardiales bacterium]|nr:hypothetical protein [Pseudonocardiales bacterium]